MNPNPKTHTLEELMKAAGFSQADIEKETKAFEAMEEYVKTTFDLLPKAINAKQLSYLFFILCKAYGYDPKEQVRIFENALAAAKMKAMLHDQ